MLSRITPYPVAAARALAPSQGSLKPLAEGFLAPGIAHELCVLVPRPMPAGRADPAALAPLMSRCQESVAWPLAPLTHVPQSTRAWLRGTEASDSMSLISTSASPNQEARAPLDQASSSRGDEAPDKQPALNKYEKAVKGHEAR